MSLMKETIINSEYDETAPFLTPASERGSHNKSEDADDERSGLLHKELEFGGDRSFFEVGFNICNTIIGSGIIGLPYAMKIAGFGLGIILLVAVAIITDYSLRLLIFTGMRARRFSYADLFDYCFGRLGFYMMNIVLAVNSTGGILSYLIITGDTVTTVLGHYFPQTPILADRRFVVALIGSCLMFPLSCVRDLGRLSLFSVLSIFCIPFIVISVAIQAFTDERYIPEEPIRLVFAEPDFFPAIGTMAFAYVCSQVAFIHFRTLKKPTLKQWGMASSLGVSTASTLCLAFAVIGYLAFGPDVQANILLNFADDDLLINIARMFLVVTMILTYPFAFVVVRLAALKIIGWDTEEKPASTPRWALMTVVLSVALITAGMFITDLGSVYALFGALCSVSISYIFPAVMSLRADFLENTKIFSKQNILVFLLLIFGVATMIASTTITIMDMASGDDGSQGSEQGSTIDIAALL